MWTPWNCLKDSRQLQRYPAVQLSFYFIKCVFVFSVLQGATSSTDRVKWREEDASPASPSTPRASPSSHLCCCKSYNTVFLSAQWHLLCRPLDPAQQRHLVDESCHYISWWSCIFLHPPPLCHSAIMDLTPISWVLGVFCFFAPSQWQWVCVCVSGQHREAKSEP